MATKAETRDRAGEMLAIKRVNQPMQDEHKVRVEASYDEVFEDLKKEGIATWSSTGTVPTEIVPHMAALIAALCTETYAVSDKRYNRIFGKAGVAKREIRKLVTPDYESLEEPDDF